MRRIVGFSMAVLFGCGTQVTQKGLDTPAIVLPTAEHAYALPLSSVSMVDFESPEQLMEAIETSCGGPEDTLPSALVKPAVLTATQEALLWNGRQVAKLSEGVVSVADTRGLLITPLFSEVLDQVEQTKQAHSYCLTVEARGDVAAQFRALLVVDARIPERTMGAILYTLGQAQISSFAYAVQDPTPETARPEGYVGGKESQGRFGATETDWTWTSAGKDVPTTFPRNAPLSPYLGASEPQTAAIGIYEGHPISSFARKHDVLAGAGIHCVMLAFATEAAQPVTRSTSESQELTTRVPIHAGETVSAHLLALPQVLPPSGKQRPIVQADGTQCYTGIPIPSLRPKVKPQFPPIKP